MQSPSNKCFTKSMTPSSAEWMLPCWELLLSFWTANNPPISLWPKPLHFMMNQVKSFRVGSLLSNARNPFNTRSEEKGDGVCKGQKTWRQSLVRLLHSWGKRWTHSLCHFLLFFQSFSYRGQDFISSFWIAHQEYKASPYLKNTLFVEKYLFPIRELTRFWQHNAKLHFFQERTIFQHVPQCVTG